MKKVFLDVGAHTGETLREVLFHDFDEVLCFEPVRSCIEALREIADSRTTIFAFGLGAVAREVDVFNAGSLGATIHIDGDRGGDVERCQLVDVGTFFSQHLSPEDEVWMKLNCEGSECDILDRLIDTNEIFKISYLMVDFDVRKIPSLAHREFGVRARLDNVPGLQMFRSEQIMFGPTHESRIRNWITASKRNLVARFILNQAYPWIRYVFFVRIKAALRRLLTKR